MQPNITVYQSFPNAVPYNDQSYDGTHQYQPIVDQILLNGPIVSRITLISTNYNLEYGAVEVQPGVWSGTHVDRLNAVTYSRAHILHVVEQRPQALEYLKQDFIIIILVHKCYYIIN